MKAIYWLSICALAYHGLRTYAFTSWPALPDNSWLWISLFVAANSALSTLEEINQRTKDIQATLDGQQNDDDIDLSA